MGFLATLGQVLEEKANQAVARSSSQRVNGITQFPGYTPYSGTYGSSGLIQWLFSDLLGDFEPERDITGAASNSIVDICLAYIARNFILADGQAQQQDGKGNWEPMAAHPVVDLIENPNEFYDNITLWAATAASLARGNAYWILGRDAAGGVREIWWAPQLWNQQWQYGCTPYREPGQLGGLPFCYQYRAGGLDYFLPLEDVIHFRLPRPDPLDPFIGLDPLLAQLGEIGTDNERGRYSEGILKTFGVVGAFLINKSGKPLGANAAEDYKARYRANSTGKNRGDINILEHDFDIKYPETSPDKMAITELGDTPEERIPAALGLNAIAISLGAGLEKSTYSNNDSATRAAWDQGIAPLHKICSNTLSRRLMPQMQKRQTSKTRWFFDYSEVPSQQDDENALRTSLGALWEKNAITIGQLHAMLRMELPAGVDANLRFCDLQVGAQTAIAAAQKPQETAPASEPTGTAKKTIPAFRSHSTGLRLEFKSKADRAKIIEQARALMAGTNRKDREAVHKNAVAQMSKTAMALRDGESTVAEWSKQSRADILAAHAAQTLNGYDVGPDDDLPEHMWDWLAKRVESEYGYFDGFEKEVKAGEYDNETEGEKDGYTDGVVSRQSMYANSTRATYENAGLQRGKDDGHAKARRVMAAVEHCGECEEAAGLGWVDINDLPEIGDSTCKANCACVIITGDGE